MTGCERCHGSGSVGMTVPVPCPACGGEPEPPPECMNPECDRLGTISLRVFDKHVGMVCEWCNAGIASVRAQPPPPPPPNDPVVVGGWGRKARRDRREGR